MEDQDKHLCPKCNNSEYIKVVGYDGNLIWVCHNCRKDKIIDIRIKLEEAYNDIIKFISDWVDMNEDNIKVISTWIIGTYYHKQFNTFPYLFLNAMRGSGKTRLLRIISHLQFKGNGELLNNPSEPVLFRTAQERGLIFDEFESEKSKDKQAMREYLNACYKEGGVVYRMEKTKGEDGKEKQVAVGHKLYTPVAMANINGIEDVLSDRAITIILEKSSNPYLVKKIEDFSTNNILLSIKRTLDSLSVQLCSVYPIKNVQSGWNVYINDRYSTYIHTIHTIHNYTTTIHDINLEEFYLKIDNTGIFGRNLELFFPLLITSKMISDEVFNDMLKIVQNLNIKKKDDEFNDSKDISLIEFVSNREDLRYTPIMTNDIFNQFKLFAGATDDRDEQLTITWFGLCLKRNKLILEKKRTSKGISLILNVDYAKEKIKVFRSEDAK